MNVSETVKKADEFMSLNQPHHAFRLYLDVVEYYRKNKRKVDIDQDLLTAYNNAVVLGLYLAESKNDLARIKDLALEFLKVAKKSDDSVMYAIACFHAGVAHNALDQYDKSVKYLEEALVIFELLGYDDCVMLTCKNLAEAYENLGLRKKAEIHRMRAVALQRKFGDRGGMMISEAERLFKKWKNVPWVIFR